MIQDSKRKPFLFTHGTALLNEGDNHGYTKAWGSAYFQVDLGDRLLPAFDSRSNIPYSDVNLLTHFAHPPRWGPDSSVSEVSTVQLEFRDLTYTTGDPKYKVQEFLFSFPLILIIEQEMELHYHCF